MKRLPLRGLSDYVRHWAGEGSVQIFGAAFVAGGTHLRIGESSDGAGTTIALDAEAPVFGGKSDDAKFRDLLACVLIRAGYLLPELDFAELAKLKRRASLRRIEFIFDTNALSNGVGHFLVRTFGHRADLVRSTVTEKELQRLGEFKNVPTKWEELVDRSRFLAASRLIEGSCGREVLWRRLHTESETSLHTGQAANRDGKSPGHDLMILEAARRAAEDHVPGLRRVLVTSDKALGRAAMRVLRGESLFVAYQRALPSMTGLIFTPYLWSGEVLRYAQQPNGGSFTDLATFAWEALSVWNQIDLQRVDGSRLRLSAFEPSRSAFPSDWVPGRVWVEELASSLVGVVRPQLATPPVPATAPTSPKGAIARPWILRGRVPAVPASSSFLANSNLEATIAAIDQVLLGTRRGVSGTQHPEIPRLMMSLGLGEGEEERDGARDHLRKAWLELDVDFVASWLSRWEPFSNVCARLESGITLENDRVKALAKRSASLASGMAVALGHAVRQEGTLGWGGARVGPEELREWLVKQVRASGAREVAVEDLCWLALEKLHLSPMRFGLGVRDLLGEGVLELEPVLGGALPVKELAQRVLFVHDGHVTLRSLGVGDLFPFRSLKARS